CQTGFSNPSTISSTTAATLGTHSSTSPGRLCPSRDATGQQSVTQSEDWYYMPSHAVRSLWLIYGTSKNSRRSTRLARLKRARPRAGAWRSPERSAPFRDSPFRQKAVRRSHRLRHDNWVIGSRCGRNSFSSGTTSVLRAVFASRDEPMASAPALPEATVSGQFVQIFGRKEN